MKKDINFYSEGQKIAGNLYFPDNYQEGNKYPGIILCHGFAGIKEVLLPPYAESFAKAGFIALVFDYRGFGDSEGDRGRLIPQEQVTDIRNAITYLQSLPEIEPEKLGLWGTSFGGANAIYTSAADKRVQAVAVQLTFGNGERVIKQPLSPEDSDKLDQTTRKVWERLVNKNKDLKLSPDQILTDEDSKIFYQDIIKKYPEIQTKISLTTLRHTMEYKPEEVITSVNKPVLIIAAEHDAACPLEESKMLYDKANEPKLFHLLKGAKHYDTYTGEFFKESCGQAVQWFKERL
ncbi:MAG: alpha/beta hydrolase [Candidatus Margulisiibacteriota bacterium]